MPMHACKKPNNERLWMAPNPHASPVVLVERTGSSRKAGSAGDATTRSHLPPHPHLPSSRYRPSLTPTSLDLSMFRFISYTSHLLIRAELRLSSQALCIPVQPAPATAQDVERRHASCLHRKLASSDAKLTPALPALAAPGSTRREAPVRD